MHYYQFNIGDYHSHTSYLEPMEDLAYRRMMDWCYLNEKPLPNDLEEIGRLIRMRTHCECIAVVLRDFFICDANGYSQPRIDDELARFSEKSDKARKSAEARWGKKSNKNKAKQTTNANALRTQSEGNANQEPLTTNQEPIIKHSREAIDYLNQVAGKNYKYTDKAISLLKSIFSDYEIEQVKFVIDNKAKQWLGIEQEKYLRPETLFNKNKFEAYVNEPVHAIKRTSNSNGIDFDAIGRELDEEASCRLISADDYDLHRLETSSRG